MKKSVEMSYKKLATAVAFAAAATTSGSLVAQDSDIEEIQVTGSFISRPADRPQPVSVMDNEELQANQRVTIAEAVRDMPQISSANTVGNWATPTNSINLRGLGTRSTLILLNGQRQTIDANGGSQVDINNLAPAIMLERIELVLDGASALYGSDAVAGVANFITRNNFEGAEISVSSQHADHQTSVPEVVFSGIFGVQGDDLGIVMGLEWFKRADQMQAEDRWSNERLGEGLITGLYNPGTFGYFGPPQAGGSSNGFFGDPLCGSPEVGGLAENVIWDPAGATGHNADGLPDGSNPAGFCRGTLSLQRTIIPQNEQLTGMAVVTKQFGGDFLQQATLETSFARVETLSSFGTGVPLLALTGIGAKLPANNPGVIDAHQRSGGTFPLQDFNRIFTRQASPLEGDLTSFARQNTFRASLGLEGMLTEGWDWRLTGTMSFNEQTSQSADTIADRYARAIQGYGGPGCKGNLVDGLANNANLQQGVGGCQWWNPFASRLIAEPGDATYNDPALQDWMTWGGLDRGTAEFYSMEFITTGELWEMAGGATGFAAGVQYRRQVLDILQDPIAKDGGFGFAPQVIQDWSSNRDTEALFAEMVMYPTDTLELDVAARYESTLGQSSVEPKISMLWTPTDNLFVRASAGSSFRLGSEFQSFGIGASGTTIRAVGGEVTQARAIAAGNPNLKPEESDNWTVGFTWDINDAWTVEVNYWDYEFTNLITTVSPDDVLLEDMADGIIDDPRNGVFPGRPREVCEVTGRWSGNVADPLPAGCITGLDFSLFTSSFVNRDTVETSGVDYSIDYSFDLAGGEAGLRLTGVNVQRYAGTTNDGQLIDVVGTNGSGVSGVGTNPENRVNLVATYATGNHNLRWTSRWTDGSTLRNPGNFVYNTIEGGATFHDFVYSYTIPGNLDSSVTLSILNVSEKDSPLVANSLTTENGGLFDPRGRMYRLSYNLAF
jgi:iron complex outermembrane recepter protein